MRWKRASLATACVFGLLAAGCGVVRRPQPTALDITGDWLVTGRTTQDTCTGSPSGPGPESQIRILHVPPAGDDVYYVFYGLAGAPTSKCEHFEMTRSGDVLSMTMREKKTAEDGCSTVEETTSYRLKFLSARQLVGFGNLAKRYVPAGCKTDCKAEGELTGRRCLRCPPPDCTFTMPPQLPGLPPW